MQRTFCDLCAREIASGSARLSESGSREIGGTDKLNIVANIGPAPGAPQDVCNRCLADALRVVANEIDDRRREERQA